MRKMKLGWVLCGEFDEDKVVEASYVNSAGKPSGGIWLSPLTETGSMWSDFCKKEGMNGFLRHHHLCEVEVIKKGIHRFRSRPTKKKIEQIMMDSTKTGFFVPVVYDLWDVPTVWLKDASALTILRKKECLA